MSVVDPSGFEYGTTTGIISGEDNNNAVNVNTTPAHLPQQHQQQQQYIAAQQQTPQPPPAHQQPAAQDTTGRLSGSGSEGRGGRGKDDKEDGDKPKLHFPWMKTTKSHAHQWQANWPGKLRLVLELRVET